MDMKPPPFYKDLEYLYKAMMDASIEPEDVDHAKQVIAKARVEILEIEQFLDFVIGWSEIELHHPNFPRPR
jgi:hypothetical protein